MILYLFGGWRTDLGQVPDSPEDRGHDHRVLLRLVQLGDQDPETNRSLKKTTAFIFRKNVNGLIIL